MSEIEHAGPNEPPPSSPPRPTRKALRALLSVFWNGDERRVRALWRLVALGLTLSLASVAVRATGLMPERGTASFYVLGAVLNVVLALGAVGSVGWLLDRRRLREFGLSLDRDWWADLGFGLVLGAFLMTMIFLVKWTLGWVRVTGTFRTLEADDPFGQAILVSAVLFLGVGILEELLARGYLLRNLAEGLAFQRLGGPRGGLVAATTISSVLFALGHANNPNASWVSTVNIALAGALLALGLLITGQLALPIGLHITWNFFQASVFGFPVSGVTRFRTSFIATEEAGPDAWTGGVFGPEAGLLGLAAMIVSAALMVLWVRWRRGAVRLATRLAEPPARGAPRREAG